MAEAARKLVEATARRVVMSDVIKHADWLVERVTRRWPTISKQAAIGWLRTVADDGRNFFFVMNEGGMALCEQAREDLNQTPIVFERFVLAWDQAHIPQAAMLYRDIKRWGETIGAREVRVESFTDIPRPLIKMYLGKQLYERVIMFVPLGDNK